MYINFIYTHICVYIYIYTHTHTHRELPMKLLWFRATILTHTTKQKREDYFFTVS
jgi:hypothetical protein